MCALPEQSGKGLGWWCVDALEIEPTDAGVRLRVWVKPRASRSRVCGIRQGNLEVAVAAPPVDGQANQELCAFVAKQLGVAKSAVRLVAGEGSRTKTLAIDGVDATLLRQKLSQPGGRP
ncbi:MAG: DUF167 domain-containing protein [Myxococcales bacterium]|nr:DUF167 domain-containing protein [Myxococcales bacterium]